MSTKIRLNNKDIVPFTKKSDIKGLWLVIFNWGLIAFAFALSAVWFNPVTVLISLVILGNRQLGLAILMHECSHLMLFKSHQLNNWFGQLFCGAPILAELNGYRIYHMKHHKEAGTTADPDYKNYKNYPVSKTSLMRKTLRDLSGITGIKTLYAILLMNAGIIKYDLSYQSEVSEHKATIASIILHLCKNLAMPTLIHVAMWFTLYALGYGSIYILWWVSYFTVYMFILRIRNAAEHGNVPELLNKDPLLHARTIYASWWERLIFAPNYVNYHVEHHIRSNVPSYHLKAFHHFLKKQGVFDEVRIGTGYIDVIKQLTHKVV